VIEVWRKREVLVQWREELRRQEPVVTDVWWLPAVLAPYWVEHPVFVVPRHSSAETVAVLLQSPQQMARLREGCAIAKQRYTLENMVARFVGGIEAFIQLPT